MVKPAGHKFESLGPVSFFSEIHSSKEKNFTSINNVTFAAMERGSARFGKAAFALDRGYDANKMFLKLDDLKQDYVIRLTARRNLCFHGKWIPAAQMRNQRKGKIKTPIIYKGMQYDAYLSHVKVQITASRKDIYLVLVYGITKHPMMLAANKVIRSKEDVIKAAKISFSRWRIEEYFRCKTAIIRNAAPIKEKVHFCYYRLAKGISGILSYAKEGTRLWFRTKHPVYRQLCLS